ncbi:hypothetical protein LSH36_209g02031 [Paralvinella palmiformis]|uniref:E3 ubiquitin-protein ligase HECTD3 n=1 Tax=Paralvinella palmiformis TaxID=53620 RepID=A0AAD9JNP9_9ANNE|nr:hypothetical protein LSH36_209g02031 [Paralvinella palmiformis]
METRYGQLNSARKRLARIRCLDHCVTCLRECKPLPKSLCYVPKEVKYKVTKTTRIPLYRSPGPDNHELSSLIIFVPNIHVVNEDTTKSQNNTDKYPVLVTSGEEVCNSQGQWARFLKYTKPDGTNHGYEKYEGTTWLLLCSACSGSADTSLLERIIESHQPVAHQLLCGVKQTVLNNWESVVEYTSSVLITSPPTILPSDPDAVERLSTVPPNWTLHHDEDLGQFLCHHLDSSKEHQGTVSSYVESIKVSSTSEEDEGPDNLTDGDPDTYWESDGNQGDHCITLTMKKSIIIKIKKVEMVVLCGYLTELVEQESDGYEEVDGGFCFGTRIVVKGGDENCMKQLNDVSVDQKIYGPSDIVILEDQIDYHPVIQIWIKEYDGIDTRIHSIKMKSSKELQLGLNKDLFSAENLVRFPKLETYDANILYRRALVLQRFVSLIDSVLPYIVPTWEYSIGSVTSVKLVRQLLPMSKKRNSLIDRFLKESESGQHLSIKRLFINRLSAAEHRADPSQDPLCKNSVFCQVFEGLKPRERTEKPLHYRWSTRFDQWWECKFIGEGIIDQGGGFRDSLSEIADELCPSSGDVPIPLPYFIRSPNQVLSLPPFIWKKLSEENVTWMRDYITVDESEVRIIENMDMMNEQDFDAYFSEERTWMTVLSNGTLVPLIPDGVDKVVQYGDRHEYSELVKATRMSESDQQIDAIKRGLLSVVPKAVLDLLTWQELEKRVCGNPDITIETLKRSAHYEDIEDDDTQVKYMWEALTAFSVEDRSRFLRFVTGRRRLPAPLYICQGKGVDTLPESSTCSNTLFLPNYTSAKVAEEKLRYASYNCIAIDTDMSPWDT